MPGAKQSGTWMPCGILSISHCHGHKPGCTGPQQTKSLDVRNIFATDTLQITKDKVRVDRWTQSTQGKHAVIMTGCSLCMSPAFLQALQQRCIFKRRSKGRHWGSFPGSSPQVWRVIRRNACIHSKSKDHRPVRSRSQSCVFHSSSICIHLKETLRLHSAIQFRSVQSVQNTRAALTRWHTRHLLRGSLVLSALTLRSCSISSSSSSRCLEFCLTLVSAGSLAGDKAREDDEATTEKTAWREISKYGLADCPLLLHYMCTVSQNGYRAFLFTHLLLS